MKTVAIVTAGGSGERFPGECKKQFRPIAGKPVLAYAIDPFAGHPLINAVIVTVPAEDLAESIALLHPLYPEAEITVMEGGKTRQQSVLRALNTLSDDTDYVLIHDGVRPLFPLSDIADMLRICREVNAVIPVRKVRNTIKEVSENRIVRTLERASLVEVYTPQVFRYELIVKYHRLAEHNALEFTDDAAVLEHHGIPVYAYQTQETNIKITDTYDFEIVKTLLNNSHKKD